MNHFDNSNMPVASTDSNFDFSMFYGDPINRPAFIDYRNRKKLFPFEYQRLERTLNIERFPNRIRPEPKALKKYNLLANIAIVIGYKKFEYLRFRRGKLNDVVKDIAELVDLKESSLKAKISQLKKYVETDDKNCASKGMINTYEKYKHIEYDKLYSVLSNHESHYNLEDAFANLLNTPQSMLSIDCGCSIFGGNR